MPLQRTKEQEHKDLEFIQYVKSFDSYREAAKELGTTREYIKNKVNRIRKRFNKDKKPAPLKYSIDKTSASRYVITSALNNTPLHRGFWESLEVFCEDKQAKLIVRPQKYRNPDAFHEPEDYYFPPEVTPYLSEDNIKLNDNLVFMGDIPINATAATPLSGLDTISGHRSMIVGHSQVQATCVPTPHQRLPKILHTTGSVSQPVYSQSKAGIKAQHHHCLAAVYVELKGDKFWLRELWWGDGCFYDLDRQYTPQGVTKNHRAAALVTGDEHTQFADEKVIKATYKGKDSICNVLKPEYIVRHDVLDFYSRNHHHKHAIITNYAKHQAGLTSVEKELNLTIDHMDNTLPSNAQQIIVRSNHDDALDRWLNDTDPKQDPENALLYHKLMVAKLEEARMTNQGADTVDAFPHYALPRMKTADRTKFLERDESFTIKGNELGFHGDAGPNGARGSIQGFSKIGVKSILGHRHAPGVFKGVFQVGVSTPLKLEYVSGPSSWMNVHAVVYPNGKRSLISVIDGQWRA